jgi:pimeloyl-ACP methyl ester carboxylesterase
VWVEEQCRLARKPGFLKAALTSLRAQVDLRGQREVLLGRLPRLSMPTLIVWGTADKVFPVRQARDAISCLHKGRLELITGLGVWGTPMRRSKEDAVIRRGWADDVEPILDLLERAKSRRLKPPDGPPSIAPPANRKRGN